MSPLVSIIILTKNEENNIQKCLNAVFSQKVDFQFEVIVIDSGSEDKTIDIVKKYPAKLHQILSEEFGHGKTRNYGANLAKGEYLAYLAADAIPVNEDWLNILFDMINKDEKIAGVFGRQISDRKKILECIFLHFLYPNKGNRKIGKKTKRYTIQNIFFSTVSAIVRKDIWKVNHFNENLVMSEDQEWSKNALRMGYDIMYNPDAIVYHSHNFSFWEYIQKNFDNSVALSQIVEDDFKGTIKHIVSFWLYFYTMLIHERKPYLFPYFCIRELVSYLFFYFGTISAYLPMRINKLLSRQKQYWDKLL